MCHSALEYKISYALQNHFQFFPFLSNQVVGRNIDDTCQFCAHKKETQPRHVSLLSLQFYPFFLTIRAILFTPLYLIIRSYFKANRVAFLGIFQFHYPLALFQRHFFQTNADIFFSLFLHIEIKISAGCRFYADLNITPVSTPFLLERNHRTAGWRFFRFMGRRWCYVFRCCRRCLRRQIGRIDRRNRSLCRLN